MGLSFQFVRIHGFSRSVAPFPLLLWKNGCFDFFIFVYYAFFDQNVLKGPDFHGHSTSDDMSYLTVILLLRAYFSYLPTAFQTALPPRYLSPYPASQLAPPHPIQHPRHHHHRSHLSNSTLQHHQNTPSIPITTQTAAPPPKTHSPV